MATPRHRAPASLAAAIARTAGAACRAAAGSLRAGGRPSESGALVAAAELCAVVEQTILAAGGDSPEFARRAEAAVQELRLQDVVAQHTGDWLHSGGIASASVRPAVGPALANAARAVGRRGGRGRHGKSAPPFDPSISLSSARTVTSVADALSRAGSDALFSDQTTSPATDERQFVGAFYVGEDVVSRGTQTGSSLEAVEVMVEPGNAPIFVPPAASSSSSSSVIGKHTAAVDDAPVAAGLIARLMQEAGVERHVAAQALAASGGLYHPAKRRLKDTPTSC